MIIRLAYVRGGQLRAWYTFEQEDAPMLPMAEQKHHVAGRLRLQLSQGKGDNALFERIRQRLSKLSGVRGVHVKPSTGGVIVEYHPALFGGFRRSLAEFAARTNLFLFASADYGLSAPNPSSVDHTISFGSNLLDRTVQSGTRNFISIKEALPLGIVAWAFIFVDPALAAAQWLTWLAFAWSIYFDLHEDQPVRQVSQQVAALQADMAVVRRLLENNPAVPGRT